MDRVRQLLEAKVLAGNLELYHQERSLHIVQVNNKSPCMPCPSVSPKLFFKNTIIQSFITILFILFQIRELQSQLVRERDSNDVSKQELRQSRARIEALVNKVSDLEGANLALNKKISDMAHQIEDQQLQYRAQIAAKDSKIQQLLDELENKVRMCFLVKFK